MDNYQTDQEREIELRTKAVELTVQFFMDKQVSDPKIFHEQYEKIYEFLINKQQ